MMWSFVILLILAAVTVQAQLIPIPARPLGFPYNRGGKGANVTLEVFLDLECPDSQAAFPILKNLADHYGENTLRLKLFLFPLPYHRNAFLAAKSAQVIYDKPINKTGNAAVIDWVAIAFKHLSSWSTEATRMSNQEQVERLLCSYTKELGYDPNSFYNLLQLHQYDSNARVMWKYGCSRGVGATPWFLLNGVMLPADATWSLKQWEKVIDALLMQ